MNISYTLCSGRYSALQLIEAKLIMKELVGLRHAADALGTCLVFYFKQQPGRQIGEIIACVSVYRVIVIFRYLCPLLRHLISL